MGAREILWLWWELVDPPVKLVNTPPKRPSSQGGAIARGSFAQSTLGLLAARSQLRGGLAPLLNLLKVGKFLLYANTSGANPRGHQSANSMWARAVTSTLLIHYHNAGGGYLIRQSTSQHVGAREILWLWWELVDPPVQLVNTPPKRPSSQGGAIARGSFAQSTLGLLAARSQLRGGLAPLLNLHKVGKFLLYANTSCANPRGHQSANSMWARAVTSTL